MANEIYEVDFNIAAERVTPPQYRKPSVQAWFAALLNPLKQLRNKIFKDYANGGTDWEGNPIVGARERVKYNSRTIVFEAILNKTFGVTSSPFIFIQNNLGVQNEIYIGELGDGNAITYFGDAPNQSTTIFTGEESDYNPANDFTVYVPAALYATLGTTNPERDARVQKEVDKYKIMGMINNIATY